MTTAEKYVTAAYCVVFAVVLVYVLLIAVKLGRLDREVDELERRVETPARARSGSRRRWLSSSSGRRSSSTARRPSAYLGDARHPGRAGRLATWGVRLGWLAQTALLAAQAARDDGFPWGTWAASLNLFVWLVVSAYLIWGCRGAVPAARSRRDAARGRAARRPLAPAAGRESAARATTRRSSSSSMSASSSPRSPASRSRPGCRGSTSGRSGGSRAAPATILRRQIPALATLDSLALRTVAWSVPLLTLGIAVGLARLVSRGDGFDARDRRDGRHVGRLVLVSRAAAARRAGPAVAPRTSRSPASCSSSSSASSFRRVTSR